MYMTVRMPFQQQQQQQEFFGALWRDPVVR